MVAGAIIGTLVQALWYFCSRFCNVTVVNPALVPTCLHSFVNNLNWSDRTVVKRLRRTNTSLSLLSNSPPLGSSSVTATRRIGSSSVSPPGKAPQATRSLILVPLLAQSHWGLERAAAAYASQDQRLGHHEWPHDHPALVQTFQSVWTLWDGAQVGQILSSRLDDDVKRGENGDVQNSGCVTGRPAGHTNSPRWLSTAIQ